jgi:hypothetical protein
MKDEETLVSFLILLEERKWAGPQLAGLEPERPEQSDPEILDYKQPSAEDEESGEARAVEKDANAKCQFEHRESPRRHDSAIDGADMVDWQANNIKVEPPILEEDVAVPKLGDPSTDTEHILDQKIEVDRKPRRSFMILSSSLHWSISRKANCS